MPFLNSTKFREAPATAPLATLPAQASPPYPGQNITKLQRNINSLISDYAILKNAFIKKASPQHLEKNIQAFDEASKDSFGDVATKPGFVFIKLASNSFKLWAKMQSSEVTVSKTADIEETFNKLSTEYEKYQTIFENLRRHLEESNRGPREFYLYGVGVHYEVIGNQEVNGLKDFPTLEHGKEMIRTSEDRKGKKRAAEEDEGAAPAKPTKKAKKAKPIAKSKAPKPVSQRSTKKQPKAQLDDEEDGSGKSKSNDKNEGAQGATLGENVEAAEEKKVVGTRRSARVPKPNRKFM